MLHPGVQYLPLVVSDKVGKTNFFEYIEKEQPDSEKTPQTAGQFSSLIDSRVSDVELFEKRTVTCETVTGDFYLETHHPDKKNVALWVDVEGAQDKVLAGLESAFEKGRIASVFLEVEAEKLWGTQTMLADDIAAYMEERGMVACFRDNQFIKQYNIVFIRKDLVRRHADQIRDLADRYTACIAAIR